MRAKAATLVILWGTILASLFLLADSWWARGVLLAVGVGVTLHILLRKTRRAGNPETDEP